MMPKPAIRYNRQVCDALPSSTTHRGSPDVAGWSAYPSIAVISISLPDRRDGPLATNAVQQIASYSITSSARAGVLPGRMSTLRRPAAGVPQRPRPAPRRPRQPAEAATPSNYFLCRDPGAGFAPSCLGECAMAARHEPEHRTMWYRKYVGGWERAARLIGGGLMLICGVVALHASPLGLLLSGAGVVTLVTGVFGYCPACAIAGREPLKG